MANIPGWTPVDSVEGWSPSTAKEPDVIDKVWDFTKNTGNFLLHAPKQFAEDFQRNVQPFTENMAGQALGIGGAVYGTAGGLSAAVTPIISKFIEHPIDTGAEILTEPRNVLNAASERYVREKERADKAYTELTKPLEPKTELGKRSLDYTGKGINYLLSPFKGATKDYLTHGLGLSQETGEMGGDITEFMAAGGVLGGAGKGLGRLKGKAVRAAEAKGLMTPTVERPVGFTPAEITDLRTARKEITKARKERGNKKHVEKAAAEADEIIKGAPKKAAPYQPSEGWTPAEPEVVQEAPAEPIKVNPVEELHNQLSGKLPSWHDEALDRLKALAETDPINYTAEDKLLIKDMQKRADELGKPAEGKEQTYTGGRTKEEQANIKDAGTERIKTRDVEDKLHDLGFMPDEVYRMTADEAGKILEENKPQEMSKNDNMTETPPDKVSALRVDGKVYTGSFDKETHEMLFKDLPDEVMKNAKSVESGFAKADGSDFTTKKVDLQGARMRTEANLKNSLDLKETPPEEVAAKKDHIRETLKTDLENGTIEEGTPVRLTSVAELSSIINNETLSVKTDFEGKPGISAQRVEKGNPIIPVGPTDQTPVGIVFPKSAIERMGEQPHEVSIKPDTNPSDCRFLIGGVEGSFTFDQLKNYTKKFFQEEEGFFDLDKTIESLKKLGREGSEIASRLMRDESGRLVFHGTKAMLDRFLDQFIGSGEGAQVYGHGHYFTSLRDIAHWYAKNIGGRGSKTDTWDLFNSNSWHTPEYKLDGENVSWTEAPSAFEMQRILQRSGVQGLTDILKKQLKDRAKEYEKTITALHLANDTMREAEFIDALDDVRNQIRIIDEGAQVEVQGNLGFSGFKDAHSFIENNLNADTAEHIAKVVHKYANQENEALRPTTWDDFILNKTAGAADVSNFISNDLYAMYNVLRGDKLQNYDGSKLTFKDAVNNTVEALKEAEEFLWEELSQYKSKVSGKRRALGYDFDQKESIYSAIKDLSAFTKRVKDLKPEDFGKVPKEARHPKQWVYETQIPDDVEYLDLNKGVPQNQMKMVVDGLKSRRDKLEKEIESLDKSDYKSIVNKSAYYGSKPYKLREKVYAVNDLINQLDRRPERTYQDLVGKIVDSDITDEKGNLIAKAGDKITKEQADRMTEADINYGVRGYDPSKAIIGHDQNGNIYVDGEAKYYRGDRYSWTDGESLQGKLQGAFGRKGASDFLKESGIPGNTYIGGTSGERNYVIFDENLPEIKKAYTLDVKDKTAIREAVKTKMGEAKGAEWLKRFMEDERGFVTIEGMFGGAEKAKKEFVRLAHPLSSYVGNKVSMLRAGAYDGVKKVAENYKTIAEPFGGTGIVGNFLTEGNKKTRLLVNDINEKLINFHNAATEAPHTVVAEINKISDKFQAIKAKYPDGGPEAHKEVNRLWASLRDKQDSPRLNDSQRAAIFTVMNSSRASVGGGVPTQGLISGGKSAKPFTWSNFDITKIGDEVYEHAKQHGDTTFTNTTAEDIIRRSKKGDLLVVDPPYIMENKDRIKSKYYEEGAEYETKEGAVNLIDKVLGPAAKRGVDMVYTNHDHPAIEEALIRNGFTVEKVEVGTRTAGGRGTRTEIVGKIITPKEPSKIKKAAVEQGGGTTLRSDVTGGLYSTLQEMATTGGRQVKDFVKDLIDRNLIARTWTKEEFGDNLPDHQSPGIPIQDPEMKIKSDAGLTAYMRSPHTTFTKIFDLFNRPDIDAFKSHMSWLTNTRNSNAYVKDALKGIKNAYPDIVRLVKPLFDKHHDLMTEFETLNNNKRTLERERNKLPGGSTYRRLSKQVNRLERERARLQDKINEHDSPEARDKFFEMKESRIAKLEEIVGKLKSDKAKYGRERYAAVMEKWKAHDFDSYGRELMARYNRVDKAINTRSAKMKEIETGQMHVREFVKLTNDIKKINGKLSDVKERFKALTTEFDPLLKKMAEEHADVRVYLEASGELPEGIKLSEKEKWSADQLKKYMEDRRDKLEQLGIPVIKSKQYMTHLWKPLLEDSSELHIADKWGEKPTLLSYMSRLPDSRPWIPSANEAMKAYVPSVEYKLAYQPFLDRWRMFVDDIKQPRLKKFMDDWIAANMSRKELGYGEKVLNAAVGIEYVRTIGLSLSVAVKHAMKVLGTPAEYGFLNTLKALPQTAIVPFQASMEFGQVHFLQFAKTCKKLGIAQEKDQLMLFRHYIAQSDLVRMMTEIPALERLDRGLLTPHNWQAIGIGGNVIKTAINKLASQPVKTVEALENGVSVMAGVIAGKSKGINPKLIERRIWEGILDVNFRAGWDQPLAQRTSPWTRGFSMFQTTPLKLQERLYKWVHDAFAIHKEDGKLQIGYRDAFGTHGSAKLLRFLVLVGVAETIARQNDTSVLGVAMAHIPWAGEVLEPTKKGYKVRGVPSFIADPLGYESPALSPATSSPIFQYLYQLNKYGVEEGTKEHLRDALNVTSKVRKAATEEFPTKYSSSTKYMLGLPELAGENDIDTVYNRQLKHEREYSRKIDEWAGQIARGDESKRDEAYAYIDKQPEEVQEMLEDRLENSVELHELNVHKWWQKMARLTPENKARVFWEKYKDAPDDIKDQMDEAADTLKGYESERFEEKLDELMDEDTK